MFQLTLSAIQRARKERDVSLKTHLETPPQRRYFQGGRKAKQAELDVFAQALSHPLDSKMQGPLSSLFQHQSRFFHPASTESGALAVVGFLVAAHTDAAFFDSTGRVNKQNLEMALHLFFGKDLAFVAACLKYAGRMRFHADTHQLQSTHYHFQLPRSEAGEAFAQRPPSESMALVDVCNQRFFYNKPPDLIEHFAQSLGFARGHPHHTFLMGLTGKYAQDLRSLSSMQSCASLTAQMSGKQAYERTVQYAVPAEDAHAASAAFAPLRALFPKRIQVQVVMTFAPQTAPVLAQRLQRRVPSTGPLVSPVNLYTFQLTEQFFYNEASCEMRSSITCCASLTAFEGDMPTSLLMRAQRVVSYADPAGAPFIIDFRALRAHWHSDELDLFEAHQGAIAAALESLNVTTPYFPVLCNVASKPLVGALAPLSSKFESQRKAQNQMLRQMMRDLFVARQKGRPEIERYAPILERWERLLDSLGDQNHVAPFLTYTVVLQGVLGFQIWLGCKSAKDRTTVLLAGLAMLKSVIEARLLCGQSIANLFDDNGRLIRTQLSVEEVSLISALYDPNMMHVINRDSLGVEANIAGKVLTRGTFSKIDCVSQDDIYTVGVGT